MNSWNKLLKRQLWKHYGDKPVPKEMYALFESINGSYNHFEKEYKLLNRVMELSSDELFNANVELRKRNDELDRFVYSTSHDLRAPLTSILGLLQLIEMTEDEEGVQELLGLIKTSAIKLDDFIGDIIMYTRNKKTEVEQTQIDFRKLISGNIEKFDFMPNSNELKKTIKVEADFPFYSDSQRLDNIFSNLISNSIKYYNSKESNPFCLIEVVIKEKHAEIQIIDNGIGIEEVHLSKIFNMFYRASFTSIGSGIGLYIVKEMIDKLKGTITVRSEFGKGTTFKLLIPNGKS